MCVINLECFGIGGPQGRELIVEQTFFLTGTPFSFTLDL